MHSSTILFTITALATCLVACADPSHEGVAGQGAPASAAELGLPYPALLAAPAGGEGLGTSRAALSLGCGAAAYHQFDFWLGDWAITQPGGSPAGVSNITKELGGCAVMEKYQGGGGRSLNLYDGARDRWTQTYIDRGGLLLRLGGGLDGADMVMEDDVRVTASGSQLKSRFTWAPRADGGVQQTWLLSIDGGETYSTNFDGTYEPASFVPPAVTPSPVCNQAVLAFRDADFLLGSWSVRTSHGLELGQTELRVGSGGCLIEENFKGPFGYVSRAFIAYDRITHTWYRVHGDSVGFVYELGGAVQGGAMALEGETLPGVKTRLRWSPNGANELEQRWEASIDGGANWGPAQTLVFERLPAP